MSLQSAYRVLYACVRRAVVPTVYCMRSDPRRSPAGLYPTGCRAASELLDHALPPRSPAASPPDGDETKSRCIRYSGVVSNRALSAVERLENLAVVGCRRREELNRGVGHGVCRGHDVLREQADVLDAWTSVMLQKRVHLIPT